MSKNKKHIDTQTAAAQNGEAFVTAPTPADAAAPKKKRTLGAWAITGIAAAGLVVLAGTAGAGAVAGIAASHSIVGQEGGHEFAEAGKFGGEHRERGGEFGEMRQRDGDRMQGEMPNAPQGQRGEQGQTLDGQADDGQTEQGEMQQGQQNQMQRPYMNGQTGAS